MIWYIQLTNKNDKDDENKNTKLIEKGRQIAEFNNAMFRAVSAKDNQGINGIIKESVDEYLGKSWILLMSTLFYFFNNIF